MPPAVIDTATTVVNPKTDSAPSNGSSIAPLDASKLTYTLATTLRDVPDEAAANPSQETICTDHMVTVSWKASTGWETPRLKPYGPLSLMPTSSVFNYATECFEGMKAYRGDDGKLRLFRPDRNCARFNISAERISLPTFEAGELKKLIIALLSIDGPRWLPKDRAGGFLYIRPVMIGTQPKIGVSAPGEALLYIITCFMPRLDSYPGGMRLHTSPDDTIRAWVGGYGYAKIGANYGPSMLAKKEATKGGFHEVLWLFGEQGECTEAGASNFFVVWRRKDGQRELVTAPLDDKLILDGVTRGSCLDLARSKLLGDLDVTERKFTIGELIEAEAEGRLLECFATGTGFFICPISQIRHRGKDINIPIDPELEAGEVTYSIRALLGNILFGRVEHDWAVVIPEKE